MPGIVIRLLGSLALAGGCDQPAIKIGRAHAYAAPRLEQRQYDRCKAVIPIQEFPHIVIKHPTCSLGDDKAERLHHTADLVAELG